jgi:triphosphoribosyl-dephospho-CoA synthase
MSQLDPAWPKTRAALSPGLRAQVACVLEVTARKAGNVHRAHDFDDTHYADFLLSAAAIAAPLDRAREAGVGPAVLDAVEATRRVVASNTNLGIILLLAPLASVPDGVDLARGVEEVLAATTVADACCVYRAIRLAQPGGLGSAPEQDVAGEPTVTLIEAMRMATDRDLIARQYANGYAEVFAVALPSLSESLSASRPTETSIIKAHLTLLAHCPDSLIARKRGAVEAAEASRRAAEVLTAGWPDTAASRAAFEAFDAWLRAERNARNPGASADVIAAALFVALTDGTIRLPLSRDLAAGK